MLCWLDVVLSAKQIKPPRLLCTLRASPENREKLNWDPNSANGVYYTLDLRILSYFPWGKYISMRMDSRNVVSPMASFSGVYKGVSRTESPLCRP